MKRILFLSGNALFIVGLFLIIGTFLSNAEIMRNTPSFKLSATYLNTLEMPREKSSSTNHGILGRVRRNEYLPALHLLPHKTKQAMHQSSPKVIAIVGGTIIDGTGRSPIKENIILIEGNRIIALGQKGKIALPKDTHKIEATGKYIIPGLMDANVHLKIGNSIELMARFEGRFEELIEEAAQIALKNGITTAFDTWGPLQPLLNVRDRIDRGELVGSRMFVAGNIVGYSGPFGRDFNAQAEKIATKAFVKRINKMWEENTGPDLGYMTPEQVCKEIRKYISRGIDFLKYASSGHRHGRFIVFTSEVQKAIVEECHKAGITVQAHTTSNESLRMAIEAGVDLITHCGVTGTVPIPESMIATLFERQIPCGINARTKKRYKIEMKRYADDLTRRRSLEIRVQNHIRLIKAGVPLLLTSDGGLWDPDYLDQYKPEYWKDYGYVIGEGLFIRCQAMAEMGLSPMDIILTATRNIASAYDKLDQLGTLKKGKIADLVILDADPLVDINNLRQIFMVMKDGQVVERNKLPIKKILYPGFR